MIDCPHCADRRAYLARAEAYRAQAQAERALYEPNQYEPAVIKALWAKHGSNHVWDRQLQLAYMPPVRGGVAAYDLCDPPSYSTYTFYRDRIDMDTYTVTRIHCQGITVEEVVTPR